uniref:EGF-like domain-containing protein n=1 Tax=Parastrongyloides trichosuri TaxID=131310 RepID=A0A0N4ZDR0_PARTI
MKYFIYFLVPVKLALILFNYQLVVHAYTAAYNCTSTAACNEDNTENCESTYDKKAKTYEIACICKEGYTGSKCNEIDTCFAKIGGNVCRKLDYEATCTMDENNAPICVCSDYTEFVGEFCQFTLKTYDSASKLVDSNDTMDIISKSYSQPSYMVDAFPYIIAKNGLNDSIQELSWQMDDFIVYAAFDQREFDMDTYIKKTFDPSLGNCYTFNHMDQNETLRSFYILDNYGYEIALQLHANDMLPWIESAHIKVFLHKSKEAFSKKSISYKANIRSKNYFYIDVTENDRLPSPYSDCIKSGKNTKNNYYDGEYTENGCFISCYLDYISNNCDCQDPSYGINKKLNDYCIVEDKKCIDSISESKQDPVYWPECKCSVPCNNVDYQITYSFGHFLTWMPECTRDDPTNMDPSSNAKSVACQEEWDDRVWIQVTLADVVRTINIEKAKYSINDIFTMIGALTGSLIGASVVTIFEIIILLLRICGVL